MTCKGVLSACVFAVLALVSWSGSALAQMGPTASITGVVVDAQGGGVPGASVVAVSEATSDRYEVVSQAAGAFTIPAIRPASYTVTVMLQGFKKAEITGIVASSGNPASVRLVLEVGALEETVVVRGSAETIQRQSAAVSGSFDQAQIDRLPLPNRNLLDLVTTLPGVSTPAGNRNSTINGLPQGTINITLDGVNVQDNANRTNDGFFAMIAPRVDAVEEVTVSSAAQGADRSGHGAVQVRFVTRSGGNTLQGSLYYYFRNDALNANTWFNERDGVEKPDLLLSEGGGRLGGPFVIPGLYDGRDRLFFFGHFEESRQPDEVPRTRTILSAEAQAGRFRYLTTGGVNEVNLFDLAASGGHLATVDPTIARLLADIRHATTLSGAVTDLADPNLRRYLWNVDRVVGRRFATVRLDYNAALRHRLSGVFSYQHFRSDPDTINSWEPVFPEFPAQASQFVPRTTTSITLRSTVGQAVNEARFGYGYAKSHFGHGLDVADFRGPVADQAGFKLNLAGAGISSPAGLVTVSERSPKTLLVEDTVSWTSGSHAFTAGGSFSQTDGIFTRQDLVPTVFFGLLPSDPATALFTPAAFPGSSNADRSRAQNLYAQLVGRVNVIQAGARIPPDGREYVYLGETTQAARLRDYGFWIQDAWRPRPDLTVNLGLRYQVQGPLMSVNSSYSTATPDDVWGVSGLAPTCTNLSRVTPETCNLFQPGLLPGKLPEFQELGGGTSPYALDWNNLAPSVGVAWTPSADRGWWSRLLGQPGDSVLRGGWSRAFNQPAMFDLTTRLDDNPGLSINANRTDALGNLGDGLLLLREPERLGPPEFPSERIYPLSTTDTGIMHIFDPAISVPYADTWSAGWQRAIGRNMAVEVRYVGTRARDLWTTYNLNETNVLENGFLDEFRLAQANLQANIASGRGANFRYYGSGTGTSPLPIYLAYFSGRSDATNPAAYGSTSFTSSTHINPLAIASPEAFLAASRLSGSAAQRQNALAAGLASNLFVANPNLLGGARVTGNGGFSNYHSLQVELRRRLSQGFQFQASYVYGHAYEGDFLSFRAPWATSIDEGAEGSITHALKASWLFEVPIGTGRRFYTNAGPWLDRLVGGWQVHGVARFQSGRIVDFGNVRMVGFDRDDLQKMYGIRVDRAGVVTMLPEDVIANTIKAFSVSATSPTGYGGLGPPEGRYFAPASGPDCIESITSAFGSCGERTIEVNGPAFKNVDLAVVKLVPIAGRVRAEFRAEILNAFNWVNFVPVTGLGTSQTAFEVTALNGETQSRVTQITVRVSW